MLLIKFPLPIKAKLPSSEFSSSLQPNPQRHLISYTLLKNSKKYGTKWWPLYLLPSGITILPKSHLLTGFFCLVNLSFLFVSNLSNACHRLSFLEEGLSVTLMLPPPPRLLILNTIIHLSLFVSHLYLNISTILLILANNQGCCCYQTLWYKTRQIPNQCLMVYTAQVIQLTTTDCISPATFVKLFYVNCINQTNFTAVIQKTTKKEYIRLTTRLLRINQKIFLPYLTQTEKILHIQTRVLMKLL